MHKSPPKWSMDEVLTTIRSWGSNHTMTIKELTCKLAMLCALSAGSRCAELSNLDTRYLIRRPNGMYFKLMKHKKNRSNTVHPGEVVFATILDKTICPCYCIEAYLEKTHDWRDTPEDPLFRGTIAPHKGVFLLHYIQIHHTLHSGVWSDHRQPQHGPYSQRGSCLHGCIQGSIHSGDYE